MAKKTSKPSTPDLNETMRRLRSGELQRSLAAMGPAPDPLREELANHLSKAQHLALDVGERDLALVIEALRTAVEQRERSILSGKDTEALVRRWAKAKLSARSSTYMMASGSVARARGAQSRRDVGVRLLLQLPWEAHEERATSDAIGVLARAQWFGLRPLSLATSEIEHALRAALGAGRWRRSGTRASNFIRAALRALGMKPKDAKKLVGDVEAQLRNEQDAGREVRRRTHAALTPDQRAARERTMRRYTKGG